MLHDNQLETATENNNIDEKKKKERDRKIRLEKMIVNERSLRVMLKQDIYIYIYQMINKIANNDQYRQYIYVYTCIYIYE